MSQVVTSVRPPTFFSHRRLFDQKVADLGKCSDLNQVKQIQARLIKANLHRHPSIAPKLISALSLCRQITSFVKVFNHVHEPNVLLYNTLIRAFNANSMPLQAFSAFFQMQRNGILPDNYTFSFLLKACTDEFGLNRIQMIHTHIVKFGFYYDIFVPNNLIDSYSKCGIAGLKDAKKLFDAMEDRDVVSWNSIIAGLVKAKELGEARLLFDEMPERDTVSWNTLIDGYVKAGEMQMAFELFRKIPERTIVSWSTMIWGYCKVGDLEMARLLFDKMPVKNLVTWTIIISGYAEKGLAKEASALYDKMQEARLKPDMATVISILAACRESGLLALGKRIHVDIDGSKLKYNTQVCNSLLDMYSKCGAVNRALGVFNGMAEKDIVSWNTMVQGLGEHGLSQEALQLFSRMKQEGFKPNAITFVGVLCACTHAGLVNEARQYFFVMEGDYRVVPQIEHYGCMIDLLGRGGFLKEAFDLVKSMPMKPNAIILGTLLGACRVHNALELAEEVIDQLIELEISDSGNYAVISNIYAAAGRWDDVARVRMQMKGTGAQKPSGSSLIEIDNVLHQFTVEDRSHPDSYRIYKMVDRLGEHLRQAGYVPKTGP